MNDNFVPYGLNEKNKILEEIGSDIAEQVNKDRNPIIEIRETLEQHIKEFETSLDSDHEVGTKLVSFGQSVTFRVHQVGFSKPSIVIFYGTTDAGEKVRLIQHISQLNFFLIAMKRNSEEPKRKIGFIQ